MPAGETYTHGHHPSVLRSHGSRTAANSAAHLLPHLRRGMALLDVGCGPGSITLELARLVSPGPVVGIDSAAAPLDGARADAASARMSTLTYEQGDVYALPLADGSVDVVHAHQLLQHLADPVAALREMRRVCRPGGLVAVRDADYAAMTWYPAEPALDRWLSLYHRLARANGGEPDAGRRLAAWARRAGFSEVTAGASAWSYSSAAERAWWAGQWAERATRSAFATGAVQRGMATAAELDELAAGWRRWGDSEDGWFAVLHGEVLARG